MQRVPGVESHRGFCLDVARASRKQGQQSQSDSRDSLLPPAGLRLPEGGVGVEISGAGWILRGPFIVLTGFHWVPSPFGSWNLAPWDLAGQSQPCPHTPDFSHHGLAETRGAALPARCSAVYQMLDATADGNQFSNK